MNEGRLSIPLNITHGFSLLLQGWTLALALFMVICALALAIMIIMVKLKPAATLGLILAGSIAVMIPNALLAHDETWKVMYAAYVAAPPDQSAKMAADIYTIWSYSARSVLVKDWYFTSRRWGICHELWAENQCAPAPARREGAGISREWLGDIADTYRSEKYGVLYPGDQRLRH